MDRLERERQLMSPQELEEEMAGKKRCMVTLFSNANTPDERRKVFMMFLTDMSFPRSMICQVMKELGINDDMTLRAA